MYTPTSHTHWGGGVKGQRQADTNTAAGTEG